jgi:hypothetical protein
LPINRVGLSRPNSAIAVSKFWQSNLDDLAMLPRAESENEQDPVQVTGSALKERIRTLARNGSSLI